MEKRIIDITCPNCSGVMEFDIPAQRYCCGYCGSNIGIAEAGKEKQGFKKILKDRYKESLHRYDLFTSECSGCGAKIAFGENEALSKCPFCQKSMVRSKYLEDDDCPEALIPFGITPDEAKNLLMKWCNDNSNRREAKLLKNKADDLKGFYLPYELIRGPLKMKVSRIDGSRNYDCAGFIKDGFISRKRQFDNLLLDGMEPFDIDGLKDFDMGYIAGQRVMISDISDSETADRLKQEAEQIYLPSIRKVLETKAVDIDADIDSTFSYPVLIPVYYLSDGDLAAVINGQTGKVSVRSLKDSYYYFLPWWLKAIIATLLFSGFFLIAFNLFGMDMSLSILLTAVLSLFFIIVILCLYSDTTRNRFRVVAGKKIFTSGSNSFTRDHGQLVLKDEILERKAFDPVFFQDIEGRYRPVILRFTTFTRIIKIILTCILVIFLPVIIALFINGFDFSRINLGGSAVWFCIFIPVVPIYLLKFAVVELHDRPWIYLEDERGKLKRYRKKSDFRITGSMIRGILRVIFIPPASLAFWFALLSFFTIIYLTAGFE